MKDKITAPEGADNSNYHLNYITPVIRKDTKLYRVLSGFSQGKSFNRFEAEEALFDHCLHSTVSSIEKLGIQIHRKFEVVPCVNGTKKTEVKRYWLDDFNLLKAQKIVEAAR